MLDLVETPFLVSLLLVFKAAPRDATHTRRHTRHIHYRVALKHTHILRHHFRAVLSLSPIQCSRAAPPSTA